MVLSIPLFSGTLALFGLDGFCGLRLGGEEVVDDGSAKDANVRDGAVIPVGSSLLCLRRTAFYGKFQTFYAI